jgi:hypothetical protein
MFYRLNVIEIIATNEVGTWAQRVARTMFRLQQDCIKFHARAMGGC